jgi:hypothetical protein
MLYLFRRKMFSVIKYFQRNYYYYIFLNNFSKNIFQRLACTKRITNCVKQNLATSGRRLQILASFTVIWPSTVGIRLYFRRNMVHQNLATTAERHQRFRH